VISLICSDFISVLLCGDLVPSLEAGEPKNRAEGNRRDASPRVARRCASDGEQRRQWDKSEVCGIDLLGALTACEGVCVPVTKAKKRDRTRNEKRRHANKAKDLLASFAEAGKQVGRLSDEAVLDVVRCCREKKTKARQS